MWADWTAMMWATLEPVALENRKATDGPGSPRARPPPQLFPALLWAAEPDPCQSQGSLERDLVGFVKCMASPKLALFLIAYPMSLFMCGHRR